MKRLRLTSRVKCLLVTSVALVLATTGLATLATAPAQAGGTSLDGYLEAAIYNDSPYDFKWVAGYQQAQGGWRAMPAKVESEDSGYFAVWAVDRWDSGGPFCNQLSTSYNTWFTYEADQTQTQSVAEFITISIHGTRKQGYSWSPCSGDQHPAIDVWQTSTKPPLSWRWDQGAPPNVVAKPLFSYQHNVPYLYDQTFKWVGERPGAGVPTIVSLGDSTISGEGGRWAGNTSLTDGSDDAGSQWYWDTPSGEEITDCHRSKSAEVHIYPHGVRTKNLACSGAETVSYDWAYPFKGVRWKPGIDWKCRVGVSYVPLNDQFPACQSDKPGQLKMLQDYASTHNVKAVVLAIGANDFNFSDITKQCMEYYTEVHLAPYAFPMYTQCADQDFFKNAITDQKKAELQSKIYLALQRLVYTMEWAGYDRSQYTVILQNYWSAIPPDGLARVAGSIWNWNRRDMCGMPLLQGDPSNLNIKLMSAINSAVYEAAKAYRAEPWWPKLKFLDVRDAFVGHRLCEVGTTRIEDSGYTKGTDPNAVDKLEWVAQINAGTGNYAIAEGGHANYWGQLAERNCLRKMWDNIIAAPPAETDPLKNGGRCVPSAGGKVNAYGEPNMDLLPLNTGPFRF